MLNDPHIYFTAALFYAAQARDDLAHRHSCIVYIGLAAVHFALALKKALVL